MASPNLQIIGGDFQDGDGVAINGGKLLFQLSHDENDAISNTQVVAGQKFTVVLDANGNIPSNPAFKVYSNDVLLPSGSFYIVRLFDKTGTEVWASPQYWTLNSSPNPLNAGSITPTNPPGSGTTGGLTLLLETNGTTNGSQSLLNLQQGANVTLVDSGSGQVTISSSGSIPLPSGSLAAQYLFYNGTTWIPAYARVPVNCEWAVTTLSTTTNFIIATRTGIAVAGRWYGSQGSGNYGGTSVVNATATERMLATFITSNQASKFAVWGGYTAGSRQFTLGSLKWFRVRLALAQTTNCRMWIVLSDVAAPAGTGGSTVLESDTPVANLVGFRYDSAVDAKWQCVTQTDDTHQTINPETTTSHVDTNVHVFEFYFDGTFVWFFIDGVQVGKQSGNMPTNSALMDLAIFIDNIGTANAVSFNFDHVAITDGGAV